MKTPCIIRNLKGIVSMIIYDYMIIFPRLLVFETRFDSYFYDSHFDSYYLFTSFVAILQIKIASAFF